MLLVRDEQEQEKLNQMRDDMRAYRIIETMVAVQGGKPPKPGTLFPSLAQVHFEESAEDVDPEENFRQVKSQLSQFGAGSTLFG